MALMAAAASRPATMSFGLCKKIRISKPRSSASTATALAPRRRRGISSSTADFLGTFLHLIGLFSLSGARRRRQRRDIADRLARDRRRIEERQRHGHRGALADPALYIQLAVMQGHEALHDRQPKAGALVAALIGLAGLKEGIADPLQILGRDADAGVADPQHQARTFDHGGSRDGTAM